MKKTLLILAIIISAVAKGQYIGSFQYPYKFFPASLNATAVDSVVPTRILGIGSSGIWRGLYFSGATVSGDTISFGGGGGSGWSLTGNSGTSGANYVGTSDNVGLNIATNGSNAIHIDSLQRIGIGTATPNQALDVNGAATINGAFNTVNGEWSLANGNTGRIYSIGETVYLGDNGNAQIINTRDSIYTSNGGIYIDGLLFNYNTPSSFKYGTFTSTQDAYMEASYSSAPTLTFTTNTVERMRIDASGNVGIGTASPTKTLNVSGSFQQENIVGSYNSTIKSSVSDSTINLYYLTPQGTQSVLRLERNYTALSYNNGSINKNLLIDNGAFYFTENATPDTMVSILNNGNVGIGTTTPTAKLQVDGTFLSQVDVGGWTYSINNGINTPFVIPSFIGMYNLGTFEIMGQLNEPTTKSAFVAYQHGGIPFVPANKLHIKELDYTSLGLEVSNTHLQTGLTIDYTNLKPVFTFQGQSDTQLLMLISDTLRNDTALVITPSHNVGIQKNNPTQALDVNGNVKANGYFAAIRSVSDTVTYTTTDYTIAQTSNNNIFLPTAVGIQGRIYVAVNQSGGNIDLLPNGSETINGNASFTLNNNVSVQVQSDGSNWYVISHYH